MAQKFELASAALMSIGGQPITSFTEGSTEATIAGQFYEPVVERAFAVYAWRFATTQLQLSRYAETPSVVWMAAYQKPAGCCLVRAVFIEGLRAAFDVYEDLILCDAGEADVVTCEFTKRIAERSWPGYFSTYVRLLLAAEMAIPLTENANMSQLKMAEAADWLRQARLNESQSRTNPSLPEPYIFSARRARRGLSSQ